MPKPRRRPVDDDPPWRDTESGTPPVEKRGKRTRRASQSKPRKKKKQQVTEEQGVIDEASVVAYFEYIDSEKVGLLTAKNLQRTAEALDVDLLPDQIQDMLDFAKEMTQCERIVDQGSFQKLLELLNKE